MVFPIHLWFILGQIFCLNQIFISRWLFFHMRHSDLDFLFFFKFFLRSEMVFPIHSVRSRSSFCIVNENSLNFTSGLVLLCFFTSSNKNFALP